MPVKNNRERHIGSSGRLKGICARFARPMNVSTDARPINPLYKKNPCYNRRKCKREYYSAGFMRGNQKLKRPIYIN